MSMASPASSTGETPAFPPQHQESQPGKQYLMVPIPQSISKDYRPSNRLQGKVALVTGGDSGIGRALCCCFALEGATVAFTYVRREEDRDAADAMEMLKQAKTADAGDPISIAADDLGCDDSCRKAVEEVVRAHGRIDILVNNAAVQYEHDSVDQIPDEEINKVFRTNIFPHFFMVRHAVKHMREGSSIINTTSVTASMGHPTLLGYASTKGAIVGFTRSLSLQLVGRGIRVNGVAPGPVWTPLIPASMTADEVVKFGRSVPMGRSSQPSEIGPSYVFLASDDSSYITGQVLHPNGGIIVNG